MFFMDYIFLSICAPAGENFPPVVSPYSGIYGRRLVCGGVSTEEGLAVPLKCPRAESALVSLFHLNLSNHGGIQNAHLIKSALLLVSSRRLPPVTQERKTGPVFHSLSLNSLVLW